MKELVKIYYDDECLFCNNYVKILELKKNYLLELKSARENKAEIYELSKLDINNGFIVFYKNDFYQGPQALQFLNTLVNKKTFLGKLHFLFKYDNIFSQNLYKLFFFLRKIVLIVMRKKTKI